MQYLNYIERRNDYSYFQRCYNGERFRTYHERCAIAIKRYLNKISLFLHIIIKETLKEMIRKLSYKTSKDMSRLKDLLDAGFDVVCFITYDFNEYHKNDADYKPMLTTDVCLARFIDSGECRRYTISCRGNCYLEYYPNIENEHTFLEVLESGDIEFIEPEINDVKLLNKIGMLPIFDGFDSDGKATGKKCMVCLNMDEKCKYQVHYGDGAFLACENYPECLETGCEIENNK